MGLRWRLAGRLQHGTACGVRLNGGSLGEWFGRGGEMEGPKGAMSSK